MKARVLKKICNKLKGSRYMINCWQESEIMESAWRQGSRVRGCWRIGGEVDEWGEGTDDFNLLEYANETYMWIGNFPNYPDGHRFEDLPDTSKFKPTTRNLLKLFLH